MKEVLNWFKQPYRVLIKVDEDIRLLFFQPFNKKINQKKVFQFSEPVKILFDDRGRFGLVDNSNNTSKQHNNNRLYIEIEIFASAIVETADDQLAGTISNFFFIPEKVKSQHHQHTHTQTRWSIRLSL